MMFKSLFKIIQLINSETKTINLLNLMIHKINVFFLMQFRFI